MKPIRAMFVGLFLSLSALAVGSCSAAKPAVKAMCSPQALEALELAYLNSTVQLINSGKCDGFVRIEECPEWAGISKYYESAYKARELCQ